MDYQSTFGHNWNEMKPIFAFPAAITAITLCTPAEARQAEAVLHVSAVVEESCSASADRIVWKSTSSGSLLLSEEPENMRV